LGLAAATSVSAFLNAGLLLIYLRKKGIYSPAGQWLKFSVQLSCAVVLMIATLLLVADWLEVFNQAIWQQLSWWQRSGNIMGLCLAGFVTYASFLMMSGFGIADMRGPIKATAPTESD
jgi:putative peptidoglycan lipid II flippase